MRTRLGTTLSVGYESASLPYLYQGALEHSLAAIAKAGFEGIDLLVLRPEEFDSGELQAELQRHGLAPAALATGGAWFAGKLHLASPDESLRRAAERFIERVVDLGEGTGAVAILGLVTGILEPGVSHEQAADWLIPALNRLGTYASVRSVGIVIEPVNRYESNLVSTLHDAARLIHRLDVSNVGILADLFHMNIEEADIAGSIREAGALVRHVHLADSNRRAPGMGHTDFAPIVAALNDIGYDGWVSVESFPLPDRDTAARAAVSAYSLFA